MKKTKINAESESSKRKPPPLWTNYKVRLDFMTRLCGSVPSDPELVSKWLDARKPKAVPAGGKTIDEIQREVVETLAEDADQPSRLVFQRVGTNGSSHLALRAATIRAHFKECARIVSSLYVGKVEGERSFAVRVVNGVYHDESQYWLPILIGDVPAKESSGFYDKAIHTRGPRGEQINSLKTIEFINGASVEFRLKVLGGCVKEDELALLFEYGGTHGYGGERSDGQGRYTFSIERMEDGKQRRTEERDSAAQDGL